MIIKFRRAKYPHIVMPMFLLFSFGESSVVKVFAKYMVNLPRGGSQSKTDPNYYDCYCFVFT